MDNNPQRNKIDYEAWSILLTNALVAYFAIKSGSSLLILLLSFLVQGIIGIVFSALRILQLRTFSQETITCRDINQSKPDIDSKILHALFLLIFFGGLYWVLFTILYGKLLNYTLSPENLYYLKVTTLVFFVERLFLYIHIRKNDPFEHNFENPLLDLVPLVCIIILGVAANESSPVLAHNTKLLLGLFGFKTFTDMLGHWDRSARLKRAKERDEVLTIDDARAHGWEIDSL